MAKKVLALFLLSMVVLAALVHLGEADASEERYKACYKKCYDGCNDDGKKHTRCEFTCDEECDAQDTKAQIDEATG